MAASTTVLTGQQQAATVLARILAVPGLPGTVWSVYPDRLALGGAEVSGQLDSGATADARAAIDTYVAAFSWLSYDDEMVTPAGDGCQAFVRVGASGFRDGVLVKIWGAAK